MASDVMFLFPSLRARRVGPIQEANGINVADAQITRGQYKHKLSHEHGGYDELQLDRLASGDAREGALLQADGVGGARFAPVPPLLVVSLGLNGKKVRFSVPTRLAEFSMPRQSISTRFSAQVTARILGSTTVESFQWRWRLYNKKTQTTIVEGEQSDPKQFSLAVTDSSDPIELHVWKSGAGGGGVAIESLRIDAV